MILLAGGVLLPLAFKSNEEETSKPSVRALCIRGIQIAPSETNYRQAQQFSQVRIPITGQDKSGGALVQHRLLGRECAI